MNIKYLRMKKIIFTILISIISVSFILPAFALDPSSDDILKRAGAGYDVAGTTETSISEYVGVYIKMALSLVGTIFLVLTIYAGILWMTASGNDEQISKATNILKAAVIGFIIVTAAYSITAFIVTAGNTGDAGEQPAETQEESHWYDVFTRW